MGPYNVYIVAPLFGFYPTMFGHQPGGKGRDGNSFDIACVPEKFIACIPTSAVEIIYIV